jgi:UDP-N-acetylglucosamine 2-epimerase (non-hydrolysing)
MVQGDSATAAMAALAAQYAGVRVAHVESGLWASNPQRELHQPCPEEFHRRMIGLAAQIHFAPTEWARQHLIREGVPAQDILVTGNTGIDALRAREQAGKEAASGAMPVRVLVAECLRTVAEPDSPVRERWEERIAGLCGAVLNLANRNPGRYLFLWPLDVDPLIADVATRMLGGLDDVLLTAPSSHDELLDYLEMSNIVLTESAGLQEEAASFGKPVLMLRETTDRPEGVHAGLAWLIGTNGKRIERAVEELARQVDERRTLKSIANPYGDGLASVRIADFFAGREVAEFGPPAAESRLQTPASPRRQPVGVG